MEREKKELLNLKLFMKRKPSKFKHTVDRFFQQIGNDKTVLCSHTHNSTKTSTHSTMTWCMMNTCILMKCRN